MKVHTVLVTLGSLLALGSCPNGAQDPTSPSADAGANTPVVVATPPPVIVGQEPSPPTPNPTQPSPEDGGSFGGPAAPVMNGVSVAPNRDSVVLIVPAVPGAVDYRAFRLPPGASITTVNGGEQVTGTVVHCAGYRQHNDVFTGARELLRLIEVTDLTEPTNVVVEAIDAPCPFPGLSAPRHEDIQVTIDEVPVADRVKFSMYTEAEIRARYGSLVVNGHGAGATLAAPGPTTPPRVLSRTTVRVTPAGRATPRTKDFFDDFDGTSGPITAVGPADDVGRAHAPGHHFANTKWDFFTYNDHQDAAQVSEARGVLHVVLPDWGQDVFASVVGVPRRPAQLSATTYLHLTWEVASNATGRRYWWVGVCGAGQAGQTFSADNHFTGRLVQTPFFYQPDGYNVSAEGWNCLQFFPRDGAPFPLAPTNTRSESDVRVMVNTANASSRGSVVNLSPAQYPDSAARPSWFRQQNASGTLGAPVLDDHLLIAPRSRFDAWVRRDRLVLFVNGEQRLCNDFPSNALTMAEAAVAFAQVLYHSAAERLEFGRSFNDRTGQRYYLENTPYADERDWDNVGYEEGLSAPAGFDASKCYSNVAL
jgi:hypothetical protein